MSTLNVTAIEAVTLFGQPENYPGHEVVQDQLIELLEQQGDPLLLRSIKLGTPHAKWRAISSLQKAIRRGNVTNGLAMASALINSEHEDHLIKRLCTIALEDVAFGDPVLCGEVFAFAASVKIRKQVGGVGALLKLVERLCLATKDRIPCEIAVSAGYSPTDDEHKRRVYALDPDALIEIAQGAVVADDWQEMQTATRMLAGNVRLDGNFLGEHRNMTAFRECFEDCPALLRYIAHRCAAGGGKSAGLISGMRLGWHLLYNHPDAEHLATVSTHFTDEQNRVVKAVMLCALDMHTQEGKLAFKRVLNDDGAGEAFKTWVEAVGGDPLAALGNGVFMVEGKRCQRRLWSTDTNKITHISHEAQMGACCLPVDLLDKLLTDVGDLLPELMLQREHVLIK